ncbi:hypothetical protein AAG570_003792 [Ranatra chinensis]|uniref:Uncharacterized protein n=1 Tax=Ranatra chinensis TaxID=642074 RepID=A0ABD0Y536_9HEMI
MYGSDFRMADSLRLLRGGQMKTFPFFDNLGLKPLLPPKTEKPDDGCIRPHPDIFCFHAGDNRVNEQLALGVLHTLTIREHNRIATQLANLNPHWDDETLYQETRHIMAALVQHITYNEFLPQLLGNKFLTEFDLKLKKSGYSDDYDPEVDATVAAAFGAAAFRFGHSLLPNTLQRRSPTHKLIGERRLSEMLQQPYDLYKPKAIDEYLLGMISQAVQAMDHSVTTEVTNHLFQDPARDFGRDLASINIARGREHGIPGYVQYRKLCGLNDITDWHHLLSFMPNSTVKQYLHLYRNLEDIDLWSAGISEFPVNGSMVGAVFSCIIANTFKDLKVGDKFWYENGGLPSSFTPSQLNEIRKYSLSRLLCNTGDNIQTIQPRAMLLPNYNTNSRVSCKSGEIPNIDLRFWRERLTSDRPYSEKPFIEEETDNLSEELNPEDEKPIGFDQVIANLIKGQNKSVYTLHLTDHHGVNNNLDQEKAVKLE